MVFGWRVVKHVKSNAIVYATADRTLGIGAGQMSRVDASRIRERLRLTSHVDVSRLQRRRQLIERRVVRDLPTEEARAVSQ